MTGAPALGCTFTPEPASAEPARDELHELWPVRESDGEEVLDALAGQKLYIADGHHRYETHLAYANEAAPSPDSAAAHKIALLTPMEEPGLCILPTHRLVRLPPGRSLASMHAGLRGWGFTVEQPQGLQALLARVKQPARREAFGFGLFAEGRCTYLEGRLPAALTDNQRPPVAKLDVSLLHHAILEPLLGVDGVLVDHAELIAYSRDPLEVQERVVSGEFDAGFFVRAPSVAAVKAVADAGQSMPQKSTYFWPKPPSGLITALL
jgi:uncharacterized protein (DUF1015 family)